MFFRAGYAPQEIMMSEPVKTDLEGRLQASGLKGIKKLLVDKPAVGVDSGNCDTVIQKRFNDLEEVFSHQGLAACYLRTCHTAFCKLFNNIKQFFL